MTSERKKSFAELCYYVAALTQSTGVQRFDIDHDARSAIEQAFPLSALLGKLRFGKSAKFKLSAEGAVEGGTALMTAFYDAIKGDCFGPRMVLWQGQFEPRLEAFWDGLKTHPVLLHMQPPMVLYNPCGPTPRQDSNPAIVAGLNDFVVQLESRFAMRKLKSSIADHQAMYRRRVERVRSRLEVLMKNFPATSWLSFSVWYAVLPGASHASRQGAMIEGCAAVKKAITACLGRREAVTLLRPVFQRDEWVRVDVALASPNIFFSERQSLAERIVAACDRGPLIWTPGTVQLVATTEAESFRVYTPELGCWEATKRLAFYYGGADLAVSHGLLKEPQLFALDMGVLSAFRLGSIAPSQAAWPFSHNIPAQANGWLNEGQGW